MDQRNEHPARFSLLLWQAGDLPPSEAQAVEAHVASCAHCRELLDAVRQDVDSYEAELPQHLQRLKNRLAVEPRAAGARPARPRWQRWAMPLLAAAVAASLILIVAPGLFDDPPVDGPRYKGVFTMQVVVKRGEEQFFAKEGMKLHPGDALAIVINTANTGHVTIFSYDSRGTLTPLMPPGDAQQSPAPHRLATAGRHQLPLSAELDEVLGKERLVAAFSKTPFSRHDLHQRAKAALERGEKLSAQELKIEGSVRVLRFEKVGRTP